MRAVPPSAAACTPNWSCRGPRCGVGGAGVGAVGCHRAPQTATLDNQVSINGITRTFVAQSWVIGCLDGGERTIQTGTSCAARKARMFRSSNSSHARSMRIVGAAAQSAWVRAPQTATLDTQVSINGITRTSVAHSLLTYLPTNLGLLILLVRLAAVVPALAIPARAARARARVGDARVIAGDPHLRLEETCSAAQPCAPRGCNPVYDPIV